MRTCGECSLCCKLLPVRELEKGANERCRHQRMTGCRIYASRPLSCQLWACQWLTNPEETKDLARPDRSHYCVDIMPDFVTLESPEGERTNFPVLQVWVDPSHRDAHRDPALRRMIDERRIAALVRYSQSDGFLLVPPSVADDGKWHERKSNSTGRTHSVLEIMEAMTQ